VADVLRGVELRLAIRFGPERVAELIVGMTATSDAAVIEKEHRGALDAAPVCELVEEILEGGRTAFETRRSKYGF
jgi:hypothetical protein